MRSTALSPLVGVTCCVRADDEQPFHVVGDKYVAALAGAAGALPVLLPALGKALDPHEILGRVDGLLVTGSPSNVEPHLYGGAPSRPGTLHDPRRDATVLPLLRAAMAARLPLLAICRGLQELNVALGGTLHQLIHELPDRRDHRAGETGSMDQLYAYTAHRIDFTPGGRFARWAGAPSAMVNSLHSQGIDRLGDGLVVEAVAVEGHPFAVAVQWHPEWRVDGNPLSTRLFAAFGEACRARHAARRAA